MENIDRLSVKEIPQNLLEYEFNTVRGECYLDHIGSALYSRTQIEGVKNDLINNFYSNPHANSSSGKQSLDTIDQVRYRILDHFHTNADEYSVVFTSGATDALKIVAETFDFGSGGKKSTSQECCGTFAYLQDNHTSVLGMREVVSARGATLRCVRHDEAFTLMNGFNLSVDHTPALNHVIEDEISQNGEVVPEVNSLFVYPAQCNFSGSKYPLDWINKCQRGALNRGHKNGALSSGTKENWYCLLDAAAFVSTNVLNLSMYKPDFVCMSFYKIFGYPTGLGALLVNNRRAAKLLKKSYYGGGTVLVALSSRPFHVKRPQLHDRFEDGTLNFLSVVSLLHGFEALKRLGNNMETISSHCFAVAQYLHERLLHIHHSNGKPAIIIYCDSNFSNSALQGNVVNFNVIRHNGEFVGYAEVQALANLHNMHIRTGCSCNPGACQRHLKLSDDQLEFHFQQGHICGDDVDLVNGFPTGSIRVSFGLYSRLSDVDRLVKLIEDCFILKPIIYKVPDDWDQMSKSLMEKYLPGNQNRIENCIYQYQNGKSVEGDVKMVATPRLINRINIGLINNSNKMPINNHLNKIDHKRVSLRNIFVYPIKSCGPLAVERGSWQIDSRGLKYDRQWMIITATGVALTQKTEPRLCVISPLISNSHEFLILTAPGKMNCFVPVDMKDDSQSSTDISFCQSKVCGDRVTAVDCGDESARWLSDLLNRPGIRLVRQSVDDSRVVRKSRPVNENHAASPVYGGTSPSSAMLNLSNQAQFLLINMATVNWLADQLPADGDCNKDNLLLRFRSNFVIDCSVLEAFVEQTWSMVKIGGKLFKVIGPCGRCQMICIDQKTGKRTKEPLTTLAAALSGKLQFGIYLQHVASDQDDSGYIEIDGSVDYSCEIFLGDEVNCD